MSPVAAIRSVAAGLAIVTCSIALAACGSDSTDSTSAGSAATDTTAAEVTNKEAGLLHVQLTMTNDTGAAREAELCDEDTCDGGTWESGESHTKYSGGYFLPAGKITYPDGAVIYFKAQNPVVGEPFVKVSTDNLGNNGPGNIFLSEGETRDVDAAGHTIHLERAGDTDYKVMSVTAR